MKHEFFSMAQKLPSKYWKTPTLPRCKKAWKNKLRFKTVMISFSQYPRDYSS